MENQFSRTELLIGKDAIEKLKKSKIAIFGIGGVGSYVVEALARAGIENFLLVDNDIISESNINRQIHATTQTIGLYKVDAMKGRILDINQKCNVEVSKEFYMPGSNLINESIDYIVDAVDTVTAKIELVIRAKENGVPIISAMGTGNKLDPTQFEVSDISKTSVCPLAKIMRKELKDRGIDKLKVVYSKENPIKLYEEIYDDEKKKKIPGSISTVPSVAGLIIANEVIKDLII